MNEIKLLKILKQKDVIMTYLPHVDGLRVHQILYEARKHWQIDEFMPELNDEKLPNREFVVNIGNINKNNNIVVNSLIPDELQKMVDRAMEEREEREEKYTKKKKIAMKVLPEFQSLFAETKEISSKAYFGNEIGENGRFFRMIRKADQIRTKKAERLLNQQRERDTRQEVEIRDKVIEELKQKIKDFEEISKENDKNAEILSRLYEVGIINKEGDLLEKNEQ